MSTVHQVPTSTPCASNPGAPAERVMAWLRDAFERGDYAPGDRLPAERELCDLTGVSRTTIRPVLAQLEAEGVISLVGRKRFYRGSGAGAQTASPWGTMVVVYMSEPGLRSDASELSRPYLRDVVDTHAILELRNHGYEALFVSRLAGLQHTLKTLEATPPAGVVCGELCPGADEEDRVVLDQLLLMEERGVPVVVAGNEPELREFDRVASDQCNGVFKLMSWLANKGCRRVLPFWHVTGAADWIGMRDSGYQLAASELGLQPLPNPFQILGELQPDRDPIDVYARLLKPFVTGPDAVDAVMLTEDRQLTDAAKACRQLGRRPGKDILLVGYDNTWQAFGVAEDDAPAATIDKDYRAEGRELADLLHERLAGQLPDTPQIRWIPPRLVVPGARGGSETFRESAE